MITIIYENILNNQDVRKNLITLRQELKEKENKALFLELLKGDYTLFNQLLASEDAKTRRNTALIMGELALPELMQPVYEAYEKEDKLFVKADYLVALRHFEYTPFLPDLRDRLEHLTTTTFEETSMKHVNEEIRILTELIVAVEKPRAHTFTGYDVPSELLLLTNRDHKEVTLGQIQGGAAKVFNAGVAVRTDDLNEILNIRTYTDMFFRLNGVNKIENDPIIGATTIVQGGLLNFLNIRHEEGAPYYFRIEIKSKMELDKKSTFAKKMAAEIEKQSQRELINSTSNYEVEIRLVENTEGQFNVLLKLYTIKDRRFEYRKNTVAASIQPAQAALVAELAKKYLREDAQVLDPFCGVGTMLIERNKVVPAKVMYGVDLFGEAIDKAIENSILDDTDIYFITRDFFDFTHRYLFDEIFTNMPARMGRKTQEDMEDLYNRFFNKAAAMLSEKAIMVMYSRDPYLVQEGVKKRDYYTILEEHLISKKEDAYVYILQVN